MRQKIIEIDDLTIEVFIEGEGEPLFLLPGLGSDVSYFQSFSHLLSSEGFTIISMNPRGISKSKGNLEGLTMHILANDLAMVIQKMGFDCVHVLGHAFGNRVARCLAADHPNLVNSVILLAAGGLYQPDTETLNMFGKLFSPDTTEEEKIDAAHLTLFSPNTAREVVISYFQANAEWPDARKAQMTANQTTPVQEWWEAGGINMLIIQGADDRIAPVENGRDLKEQFGDRVSLIEIPDAGHGMILEKPEETAGAIIDYLRDN